MPTKPVSNDQTFNPFETRWIRPDRLEYVTIQQKSVPELLEQALDHEKPMEIVGPHGVGKTTLAYSLHREATNRKIDAQLIRCGQSGFDKIRKSLQITGKLTILDEYEKLTRWQRFQVKRLTRKSQGKLIVVAHQTQGYSLLVNLQPDLQAIKAVVKSLQLTHNFPELVQESDVDSLMRQCRQDCREVLFACYDLFHQRDKKNR